MLVDKNAPADTGRVNLNEEWEVRWWCDRFGCTEMALRGAVDRVGNRAGDVERQLRDAAKKSFQNTGES